MSDLQYIRTKRELAFQECSGRYTIFEKGVPGFVLTRENIEELINISEIQKDKYFGMLE